MHRVLGIPLVPLALGLAGLIPFLWGAATEISPALSEAGLRALGPRFVAPFVGIFYGAVILSFMSGVIWGFATRAEGREATVLYVLSVVPAIYVFLFIGDGAEWAARALMFGFAGLLGIDWWAAERGLAPGWWLRLRVLLTVALLFCLLPVAL